MELPTLTQQSAEKMISDQTPDARTTTSLDSTFEIGADVIYGMQRCTVSAIETREIAGAEQIYYRVSILRSGFSRSQRQDPTLWVPVKSAHEKGLRAPMSESDIDPVMAILQSAEYYFPISGLWHQIMSQIDQTIRSEGVIGLAKAYSYAFTVKRKHVVASPEINKLYETTWKALSRELGDVLNENSKSLEARLGKLMRLKLNHDQ